VDADLKLATLEKAGAQLSVAATASY
jgi:hypothetical protein